MTTQGITVNEMLSAPVITKIVNRISTPLSLFQKFFGFMSGDNDSATDTVTGRDFGWDIFDSTRQFATGRAPTAGPVRVRKKPIGYASAHLFRAHESVLILDEEIFNQRDLGGQLGNIVDVRGQKKVARQVRFLTDRFRNQREWMLSRLLRGGFNMERDGESYSLKNYNGAATDEIIVDYQIPADNKTRLQLGTGADILSDWGDPSADVVGQLNKINAAYSRIQGRPLRHIWMNTNTYNKCLNNDGLHELGGQSVTVFESLSGRTVTSREGIPDTGFDVKFRALPLFTFHIYDGVLSSTGDTRDSVTSLGATGVEYLIPDDYIITMPDPSDEWIGMTIGSEPIAENLMSQGRIATGFTNWATRVIDPPGYELKFLDNYLPVLYVPNCIGYGFVGT